MALVIDPTDAGALYAGTNNGKVFKSVDSAGSWVAIDSDQLHFGVLALAIAPTTPGTLYAGTGGGVWQFTLPFFADGFEPGDACAWSATVGGGCL